MSRHTAGPWRVGDWPNILAADVPGQHRCRIVAEVTGAHTNQEAWADARLIAAAPDLLGVAVKAARMNGCVCHLLKNDMCLPCSARAAIAKAEGEPSEGAKE